MQCVSCGYHETVLIIVDIPYKYMGHKTVIPDVACERCPECGEVFLGLEASRKADDARARFNREVGDKIGVTPEFIRQVRKKLNLDQKEAGSIFDGGVNAFSRYETGKIPPPVPLIKLLRILNTYPDLLAMVK